MSEPINLDQAFDRRLVAERMKEAFDQFYVKRGNPGFRRHLGASVIGGECAREIWYSFRWFKLITFEPRMYSLFNEGHRIEEMLREELEGLGAVFQYPDTSDHSRQFYFSAIDGHYGGSCDGIFTWPEVGLTSSTLAEFKTKATGSGFNEIVTKSMVAAENQHYVQMCTYGRAFNLKFGAYFVYNKNDSTLYIEIVDLDWMVAEENFRKAEFIIHSQTPPSRISDRPNHYICKLCDFWSICQRSPQEKPIPNCRNCSQARPVENSEWYCDTFNQLIPKDFIKKGCSEHKPIGQ